MRSKLEVTGITKQSYVFFNVHVDHASHSTTKSLIQETAHLLHITEFENRI